jgi:hypothetical protein
MSRSGQATAAPSLAARTEMPRRYQPGGSGSGNGRVPAPGHQQPPPRQPAAPGRGAGGFGGQRHDPSHIGAAPGGSGTANAFSTNEISV